MHPVNLPKLYKKTEATTNDTIDPATPGKIVGMYWIEAKIPKAETANRNNCDQ